jgi:hypothetical protein
MHRVLSAGEIESEPPGFRQEHDTSAQDSGAETDGEEEETQVHTSQEVFRRMQEQLNDCVRHHQLIIEYGHYFN